MSWAKIRLIIDGFLLGTAGVKILSSDDAKTVYTHCTAAVMRGCSEAAKTCQTIKENCQDISADAKAINEKRAAKKEARMIEDARALLAAKEAEAKS